METVAMWHEDARGIAMTYKVRSDQKTSQRLAAGLLLSGAVLFCLTGATENALAQIVPPPAGNVSTVAGTGHSGSSGDGGLATLAKLNEPMGVSIDTAGNLYIADFGNNKIRKVYAATGDITTIAGSGTAGNGTAASAGDGGLATAANLYDPESTAIDSHGNIYIADTYDNVIRMVCASTSAPISGTSCPAANDIILVAGSYTQGYAGDGGSSINAELNHPEGLALDSSGNLYIADTGNSRVRMVNASTGIITRIAGTGTNGYVASQDGHAAANAELCNPGSVAFDSHSNLFIADTCNYRIREITAPASTGNITTVAGDGVNGYSGDSGPATSADIFSPSGVAVDSSGNFYVLTGRLDGSTPNCGVRKVIVATGNIYTVAGNGACGYSVDGGMATSAELYSGYGTSIAIDSVGDLYIPDEDNYRIRAVGATSILTPTIVWPAPAAITYGTALSATQLDAAVETLPGVTSSCVYTPALGTVLPAGTQTLSVTCTPTGNPVYSAGTATVSLTVNQAPLTVTANNVSRAYGAANPTFTASYSGFVNGDTVSVLSGAPSLTTTATTSSAVGGYTVTAAAGTLVAANYTFTYVNGTLTVTQATPVITWATPAAITYGTALSATQLDATASVAGTFAYSPASGTVPAAGSQTLSVTFTPTDTTDYSTATSSVTLLVGPAITSQPTNQTAVVGNAASYSVTASGFPTLTYVWQYLSGSTWKPFGAGTGYNTAALTTFATTMAYNGLQFRVVVTDGNGVSTTSNTATLTVNMATPVITWTTPAAITYGTELSATQLNATANVAGTFFYTPATGTALTAGSQTLTAMFTPTDTVYYNPATAPVNLTVNKATPTITWAPANIVPGTALSATQLNAVANVPGTFAYSPALGTVPAAGSRTLSVTFAPTDTADYNSVTATVTLLVQEAPGAAIITTVAGNGVAGFAGDSGPALSAELGAPIAVTMDAAGNLYIADYYYNARVRKVGASTGIITTVAGNGSTAYSGDGGAATSAGLDPIGVAVDSAGNIYLADVNNHRVRKVTVSTGIITTVAGNGTAGYSGDGGAAVSAELHFPEGIAVDSSGNIYIADSSNNRIRKVTASTGIITTVAGNGTAGSTGNGGAATAAELNAPTLVAVDAGGNLYISDHSGTVRKVTASTGIISAFAGTGVGGYSGDGGPATSAQLSYLEGMAVDTSGNVYIADSGNSVIRKVAASSGIITTVAGNGTTGYLGDGFDALTAELNGPAGVAVDSVGNLYIADGNYRIRAVGSGALANPIVWPVPAPIAYGTALSTTQLNAISAIAGTLAYSPAAGTVLTAGTQTLSVTFTPTNTADFNTATATVPLIVNQTTPPITWSTPASIASGTALSATQLNASSTVAGTFTYSPAVGAVLPAGSNTLSVTFTPTDTTDYETATQGVIIQVQKPAETAWDTGTVTLKVNGTAVAFYTYGETDTPSSVAEGLANAASGSTLVKVTGIDNSLSIQAIATTSTSDYTYGLSATNTNPTTYPYPSFVPVPISGNLDGGAALNAAGGTVYSFSVPSGGYDGAGNLLNYTDSTANGLPIMGSWTFSYDTLNRLAGATDNQPGNPSTHYCWAYDAFGNRTLQAGSSAAFNSGSPDCTPASGASLATTWANYNTVDNNNRLANTNQAPGGVSYDAAGGVLADGINQYLYNSDGQICAVASTPIPGTTTLTGYIYDAEGTRVAKGSITAWSCDPTINGFTTTNDYVLGLSGEQVTEMAMDANNTMVWQHTNVFAAGRLIATYDTNGLHFYLDDSLGTRRAQTDFAGVLEQTCSSLPFGDGLSCTGSTISPTEHHFTGKERDAESGNDYFSARYYASSMGRFMSPDPLPWIHWQSGNRDDQQRFEGYIANPQNFNMYAYVNNNPLNKTDPTGMNACGTKDDSSCKVTITIRDRSKDAKGNYNDGFTGVKNQGNYNASAVVNVNGKDVGTFLIKTTPSDSNSGAPLAAGVYGGTLTDHNGHLAIRIQPTDNLPTNGANPGQHGGWFAQGDLVHQAGIGNFTGVGHDGRAVSNGCLVVCTSQFGDFEGAAGMNATPPQRHFTIDVDAGANGVNADPIPAGNPPS